MSALARVFGGGLARSCSSILRLPCLCLCLCLLAASATGEIIIECPSPSPSTSPCVWPTTEGSIFFSVANRTRTSFNCSVDGGNWTACASPWLLRHLNDGHHVIRVTDGYETASAEFDVDTVAPSAFVDRVTAPFREPLNKIVSLRCSEANCKIKYAWNDLQYVVGTGSQTTVSGTFFLQNRTLDLEIVFADSNNLNVQFLVQSQSNKFSELCNPRFFGVTDLFGTMGTIKSAVTCEVQGVPLGQAPFLADDLTLTVTYQNGTQLLTVAVVSLQPQRLVSPAYAYRSFKIPALYVLYAQCTDAAGNVGPSQKVYNISVGIPQVRLMSAPPLVTDTAQTTFNATCDPQGFSAYCNLSFSLDGSAFEPLPAQLDVSNLSDGRHSVTFKACNRFGCSSHLSWTWNVSTSVPATYITTSPMEFSTSSMSYFEFQSDKHNVHFMCSMDVSTDWAQCQNPLSFSTSDGNHSIRVLAVDSVGRAQHAPEEFNWQVDTFHTSVLNCPTRPIEAPFLLYFLALRSGVECTTCSFVAFVDDGPRFNVTSPLVVNGLRPGWHTVYVAAIDLHSNLQDDFYRCDFWGSNLNASKNATTNPLRVLTFPSGFIFASNVSFSFHVPPSYKLQIHLLQHSQKMYLDIGKGWTEEASSFVLRLDDGLYSLLAKAISEDNETSPLIFHWHQRTYPPHILLQQTPSNPTHLPQATFKLNMTYEVSDAVVWVKVDRGNWTKTTYPLCKLKRLGNGNHTVEFSLQIPGINNNNLLSHVSFKWEIVLGFPETVVDTVLPPVVSNSSIALSFDCYVNGTLGSCSYQYQVYNSHTLISMDESLSISALWYPTQQTVIFYNLVEGSNIILVRAQDQKTGLTDYNSKEVVINVDTSLPTATLLSTSVTQAEISFTFGCNKKTLCRFLGWLNGTFLGQISNPFCLESPPNVWELQVQPVDEAGNHGQMLEILSSDLRFSQEVVINFLDTPAQIVSSTEARFLVQVLLEEFESITVRIFLDGNEVTKHKYHLMHKLHFTALQKGPHTLTVRVYSAGNSLIGISSFDWTVDTVSPVVSLPVTPPSVTRMSSAFFALSASDEQSQYLVCKVSVDWGQWTVEPCNSDLGLSSLGPGVHSLRLEATDEASQTTPRIAEHGWVVDYNASRSVPGAPFDVLASPSSQSAHVSWKAPSDNGGSAISSYVVFAKALYQAIPVYVSVEVNGTPPPTYATVTGLQNGVYYSFYVIAENVFGAGDSSSESNAILLYDVTDPCGNQLCSYQGTCMLVKGKYGLLDPYCICKPGYIGANCAVMQNKTLYVPIPSSWSECSAACDGGYRSRVVKCYKFYEGDLSAFYPSDYSTCASDAVRIPTLETCHTNKCSVPRLYVTFILSVAFEDVGFDLESQDALRQSIFLEVSYALNIDTQRLTNFDIVRTSVTNEVSIEFEIETGSHDTDLSLDVVLRTLEIHFSSEYSVLRSTGTWMRRYVPGSAHMELQYPKLDNSKYQMALGVILAIALTGSLLVMMSCIVLYATKKEPTNEDEAAIFLGSSTKVLYRHGSFRQRLLKGLRVLAFPIRVLWRVGVMLQLRMLNCIRPTNPYHEMSSEDIQDMLECWPDEKDDDESQLQHEPSSESFSNSRPLGQPYSRRPAGSKSSTVEMM